MIDRTLSKEWRQSSRADFKKAYTDKGEFVRGSFYIKYQIANKIFRKAKEEGYIIQQDLPNRKILYKAKTRNGKTTYRRIGFMKRSGGTNFKYGLITYFSPSPYWVVIIEPANKEIHSLTKLNSTTNEYL